MKRQSPFFLGKIRKNALKCCLLIFSQHAKRKVTKISVWAASGEKVPSSMRKMCGFTSSFACARSSGPLLSIDTLYSIP